MVIAKIRVNGAIARTVYRKAIPAGIIGAQVEFDYADDIWHGLRKTVVFKGAVTKDVVTDANIVTIPHEVVEKPSFRLSIGVYGVDADGNIVIPTLWEDIGAILDAADPSGDTSTDPSLPVWAQIQAMIGNLDELETTARDNLVAAVNEARQTGGGGGTNDHSKLSNRDASDQHPIGAITGLEAALDGKQPAGSYLTEESDPTVPSWAKEAQKPSYTASEVGADPSGTAVVQVAAHNTGETSHSDIRLLIQGLTDRLNALADSDDTTLDQLSEVVAYIKSNRTLIEAITTSKVSVSDIIDNLTTNASNKPLSAAQGVALKALIDAISIPTQLPNPNALTFTGAVTGSYDGSAPLSVEIPSGGSGNNDWELLADVTLTEDVATIAITQTPSGEAFSVRELVIIGTPISDGTNKTVQFTPYSTEIKYGVEIMSLGEVLSSTDGGPSYLSALIQVLPEVVYLRTQYNQYDNRNVGYANKLNASNLRNEANVSFAKNGDPITKFAIGVWSKGTAGVFRSGTKMRVYGR